MLLFKYCVYFRPFTNSGGADTMDCGRPSFLVNKATASAVAAAVSLG